MISLSHDRRPWYREPWPWILMIAPGAAVIAGAATLWIAVATSDGLVAEDYYRQGLAINKVLAREHQAQDLGIVGRAEASTDELRVRLEGRAGAPPALFAQLAHATRSGHDMKLRLAPQADGAFVTALPGALPAGRWRVSIEDPQAAWRITGVWNGAAGVFTLEGGGQR